MTDIVVRAVTEHAEIPALMGLCRAFHDESPFVSQFKLNEDKVIRVLEHSVDSGMCFVALAGGSVVGMLAGYCAPYWFTDEWYGSDLVTYVLPEHRARGAIQRLVGAMESALREIGIAESNLAVSSGLGMDRTVRLYEQLGYTHSCTSLKKPL